MRATPVVQSLTEPLLSPLVSAISGVFGNGWNPISLFTSGQQGYAYDLNDSFAEKTAYRRNLLTYSEQFNNAAWLVGLYGNHVKPTITANVSVAPDGTTSADRLTSTHATASTIGAAITTAAPSQTFTVSCWIKAGTATKANLGVAWGNAGALVSNFYVTANLTSDFQRFTFTRTAPASGISQAQLYITIGDGVSGGGVGTTLEVWGAQIEVGSIATDYQRVTDWNTELLVAFPQTTVYLDSAGTTAASVNGLVGLVLDKSRGLALGAEIRSSGAVGLVGSATVATYNTTTGEGTATRVDASNQSFVQWSGLATGSWYLLTIQNTGANAVLIRSGSQAGAGFLTLLTAETKTIYVPETVGLVTITSSGGACSFTLSTIKQAQGNHAYQSTTGNKPVLRGTPVGSNLVTNGDFATDVSGWSVSTGVNNVVLSAGTALSTMLVTGQGVLRTSVPTVSGRTYRRRMTVVSNTLSSSLLLNIRDVTSNTVITTNTLLSGVTGTFDIYFTATGSSTWIEATTANPTNSGGTYSIDNVSVFDVSAGSVQAPYALQFDGVDDFLQTASVNFTATDKMTVCHGVRKLSDAARGMLVELGNVPGVNTFRFEAPPSASPSYSLISGGSLTTFLQSASSFPAPVTNLATGIMDISGDSIRLRLNASEQTPVTSDQGTGNYGNHPFYFGRRGGTTLPYNGLFFSAICVGKTASATELANIERWTNQRTGAY